MICPHCRRLFPDRDVDRLYLKHTCEQCGQCKTACICHKRVGAIYVPRAKAAGIGSSSMYIKSCRGIGLELELADFGTWEVRQDTHGFLTDQVRRFHYTVVHDGSVIPSKLEAVFKPLIGDQQIINGLNTIAEHVYKHDCKVNETCGYHVHVDARDYSWYDVEKILTLWMNIERYPGLFKLAGRQPNTHCQTWTRWTQERPHVIPPTLKGSQRFKTWLLLMLYGTDITTITPTINNYKKSKEYQTLMERHLKFPVDYIKPTVNRVPVLANYLRLRNNRGWNRAVDSRYLNLNIHSWRYRGTIEYRLGAGTVDPVDIRMWPLFCLWLTEAVALTNMSNIRKLVNSKKDPLLTMCENGGMVIPSMKGNTVYKMPEFLKNWVYLKIQG